MQIEATEKLVEMEIKCETTDDGIEEEDLYQQMKQLEEEIEFIEIQENFIKVEQQNLKREALRAKEELKRIQSVPLVIGQFVEMIDEIYGLVNTTSGSTYMVAIRV